MLVKLKVNQSTYDDILQRVQMAGESHRAIPAHPDGIGIDLSGVAIVVDKENPKRGE